MRRADVARKRPMLTGAIPDDGDLVRPLVAGLVERAEARCRSRMLAYEATAREIGQSPRWVRKLLGRERVAVSLGVGISIAAAYTRFCERLEADAAHDRAIAAAKRGEANALVAGFARAMERATGPQAGGTWAGERGAVEDEALVAKAGGSSRTALATGEGA